MEPDAASTIGSIAEGNLSLKGRHFVLIGAGSAMGPFNKLLEYGATVIAIDVPGTMAPFAVNLWRRLITTARASSGRLIFPLSKKCPTDGSVDEDLFKCCGANLTEQPADILKWLKEYALKLPANQTLTIGNKMLS